jgi:sensor histidine kinase YesM
VARKIKKYYKEKKDAELRFLHAQIKPHYIFNALNTIISISRYNAERALELLRDFGVYLQNSFNLKTENQFTSLMDELEIVSVYLNIEKARFEERIEVEMELPERRDFLVPVCMLQPIVENAIVHGILGKPEGGKIYIGIVQEKMKLVFTVRDNGSGMSDEKVTEVLESDNIGHIGLSNIHKRLKALYKNGLTINSKPGEGTEVTWEVLLNA